MTASSAPADAPYCPHCGYNLFAIDSVRCPECGTDVDRVLARSRIPWTHRRQIGRVKAFVKTVWQATVRARAFAAELNRPVDYADARRSHWHRAAEYSP